MGEYTIVAVQRALKMLKIFNIDRNALTLTEISRILNLNKSSTLRILATLMEEHFIKYEEDIKKYKPGLELFRLGNVVSESLDIRRLAKPYLEEAVKETGFVASLGVLEGKSVMIIEQTFSKMFRQTAAMIIKVGGLIPVHCTSLGKTILAFREIDEVRDLLKDYDFEKYSEKTITNLEDLIVELKIIKERGYGNNDGEHELYTFGFAFPIYNHEKEVVASICLTGLKEEIENRGSNIILENLKDVSLKISKELGYY